MCGCIENLANFFKFFEKYVKLKKGKKDITHDIYLLRKFAHN